MGTVKTGYHKKTVIEPLFLEAEDFKNEPEKWNIIKDLLGLGKVNNVSAIKVNALSIEYFSEKEK